MNDVGLNRNYIASNKDKSISTDRRVGLCGRNFLLLSQNSILEAIEKVKLNMIFISTCHILLTFMQKTQIKPTFRFYNAIALIPTNSLTGNLI